MLRYVATADVDYEFGRALANGAGLIQRYAKDFLRRYQAGMKVSEIYNKDDDVVSALADLIGPDFQYRDWSNLTIAEVLEKYK